MTLPSYATAIAPYENSHLYLMLGNGFSIALRPDIFTYGSLYDNADFSAAPYIKNVFETLGTTDFEIVIKALQDTAKILALYDPVSPLPAKLVQDAEYVKEALVSAVAKRHPSRPYEVEDAQYAACRKFLSPFRHIFTLNYDVLLYWTLMQDEVDTLDIRPDDGFRHPEDDPNLPYVSWQQSQSATIHYLHGALHLFDRRSEITKYTWSKTDLPIVDQIRDALAADKFPLFVSEGTSDSKKERILHNAYLHKALRSFEACCDRASAALVSYGHSLADNDRHILRCISAGKIKNLLVGIYGDPTTPANQAIATEANSLVARRLSKRKNNPLTVEFFDAASAKVWG